MHTSQDPRTCSSQLSPALAPAREIPPDLKTPEPATFNKAGIAGLLLLMVTMVAVFAPLLSKQRFGYDEADYMYAVSKGFWANYLDLGTIPISNFLREGERGLKASNWPALSEYIRNSDDLAFYRHYHGPLQFYAMAVTMRIVGTAENRIRFVGLVALLLCAAASYFGLLSITPRHGPIAGCICVLLLLVSPTNLASAFWLSPHTLYTAAALVALFFLAKLIQTECIRFLYTSVIATGIAFTTIEYAALLLLTVAIVVYAYRKDIFTGLNSKQAFFILGKCAILFLLTILVIWPGGILKLTVVKNYLFFLYFTVVKSQAAYGTDSLAHVWFSRFRSSPIEFTMLAILVAIFVKTAVRERNIRVLLPFAIYAALAFASTVKNRSLSPNYVASFFPPLYVIAAVVLVRLLDKNRRAGYFALVVVICASGITGYLFAYSRLSQIRDDAVTDGVVDVLNAAGVHGEKVLVPHDDLPTAHYYSPSNYYLPYAQSLTQNELVDRVAASGANGLICPVEAADPTMANLHARHIPASTLARVPDGRVAFVAMR